MNCILVWCKANAAHNTSQININIEHYKTELADGNRQVCK